MTEAQHHTNDTRNEEKTCPKHAIKVKGRVTRGRIPTVAHQEPASHYLIGRLPSLFLRYERKIFLESLTHL